MTRPMHLAALFAPPGSATRSSAAAHDRRGGKLVQALHHPSSETSPAWDAARRSCMTRNDGAARGALWTVLSWRRTRRPAKPAVVLSAMAMSPWVTSPWVTSLWVTSLWVTSLWVTSLWVTSLWVTSLWAIRSFRASAGVLVAASMLLGACDGWPESEPPRPPAARPAGSVPQGTAARLAALAPPGPPVDAALLRLGAERYAIYCVVCHGAAGQGDGPAVARGFPRPPPLPAEATRVMTAIAANLAGAHPFDDRIPPRDRWAIARHVETLARDGAARAPLGDTSLSAATESPAAVLSGQGAVPRSPGQGWPAPNAASAPRPDGTLAREPAAGQAAGGGEP